MGHFVSLLGPPFDGHFGSIYCDSGSILSDFGSPLGPPFDGHFGTTILGPFYAILGPFR